jgi:uncharacterized protein YkwD
MKTLAGHPAGVFALLIRGLIRGLIPGLVAGLLAGCGGTGAGTADGGSGPQASTPADYARRLVLETNAARTAEGLRRLQRSRCADREARRRAQELRGQELDHGPLVEFVRRCAPGSRAAENLAESSKPAEDVVQAWMASPGHRNNIVDPGLRQVGVGCVRHEDGLLCSQLFLGDQ